MVRKTETPKNKIFPTFSENFFRLGFSCNMGSWQFSSYKSLTKSHFRMILKLQAHGISTSHSGTETVMQRSGRTPRRRSPEKRTNQKSRGDGVGEAGTLRVRPAMMRTMTRKRRRRRVRQCRTQRCTD